jgi:GDP-4-dehydro-6-deoxy-D-mannose reductase
VERALVTGCNGFVGRALVGRLVSAGYEVWGVDRSDADPLFKGKRYLRGDLNDGEFVASVLDDSSPACIVHLAAQSSVAKSFDEPTTTLQDGTAPALHILEHVRRAQGSVRVLLIGSADEYGSVSPAQIPVREDIPVNPESPYALAKAIQNHYGRMYAKLYRVDAMMTRSFNHTGPGQRDVFVLSSFAKQVAEIRRGQRQAEIEVGNLDVRRDFLDVRDVCDAYVVLLKKGRMGETYNVCSGQSYRVGDLLRELCALAGVHVAIRVDVARLRPVDTPELRGDPSKMSQHTGWTVKVPIQETLKSLLDYWDGVLEGAHG